MSSQPCGTRRFFPAIDADGQRHLILECAGSDIDQLTLQPRYVLEATGQALVNLGAGLFQTTYPTQVLISLVSQGTTTPG